MSILGDYYILCDCLDDDTELVAIIIQENHPLKEKLSRVKDDIEEGGEERIRKYHQTINKILDRPYSYIKIFKAKHKQKGLFD